MAKCMVCNRITLLTTGFGRIVLCKNCGSIINVSEWKNRDFESIEELTNAKNHSLQNAASANFPQTIIYEITNYFNEYIDAGYLTTINGKAGQILKVFKKYCIITTKNEMKQQELVSYFHNLCSEGVDDEFLSSNDKINLAKGLLSGRIIQTGVNTAFSAVINKQEKEKQSAELRRNIENLITIGDRRIDLTKISDVLVFHKNGQNNGYIKFVKKGKNPCNLYDCEYFFFNNSIPFESKKIKQKIEYIKNFLSEQISSVNQKSTSPQIKQQRNEQDVFNDIRKFKQLLDEGIITEDEFNIKKKQILGL